ncbi:hypothetical protein ONZ51_g6455 [Trametes cubensis]|uniref:DUF6533 domain-containing protein n=1 Tax=Trametes cubensis TaxID=1111947 RepID=A0AAD7TT48_9APHY|nr:hypothetical protein ONZ51_g6455 [Trametes cubensis]
MEYLLSFPSSAFHDLAATRYLSAVGLIVLFYDHCLTFADEVEYIWTAPATYAKYTFLLNRYAVLGTLLAVAYEMCGFVDSTFTNLGYFIFSCSMLAIVSIGIANLLILQRVVILWEHRPIILKVMTVGFLLSFTLQVVTMVLTLVHVLPNHFCPSREASIQWSDPLGMCIATQSSHILVAVWASPLVFEVFVLTSTALNALDRPRTVELPIIKALHSDGLGSFLAITCFRVLNLTLAALSRPSLTFLGVFFIWAMTTTVLNRLLLHLRRAECRPHSAFALDPSSPDFDPDLNSDFDDMEAETWDYRRSRAISPFGLIPLNGKRLSGDSAHSAHSAFSDQERGHGRGLSAEIAPLPYVYHYRKRTPDPSEYCPLRVDAHHLHP